MGDYFTKVKDTTKKIPFPKPRNEPNQYDEPIGPKRPTAGDTIRGAIGRVSGNPYVQGAVKAVRTRSAAVAREIQDGPDDVPRARGKVRPASAPRAPPMGGGFNMPRDPFGVGGFGGFGREPEREREAPVRRRKKPRRRSEPREPAGPIDPFGMGRMRRF